jgi:hypothetical protein
VTESDKHTGLSQVELITALKGLIAQNPAEKNLSNGTAHIRSQCRKTTVLSCLRCLVKTGFEKMNI